MKEEEFETLYKLFLEKVIKITPVAPYIQNKLFEAYGYLVEIEFRMVFNQFEKNIRLKQFERGVEPTVNDWEPVIYSLYLDKTYKKGLRTKPISDTERSEVQRMAGDMVKRLSNPDQFKIDNKKKNSAYV